MTLSKSDFHELRPGVLNAAQPFPQDVESSVSFLLGYVESLGQPKARICYQNDTAQDMLVVCGAALNIRPHLQKGRTIQYDVLLGQSSLFVFDLEQNLQNMHELQTGESVKLSSEHPRTMLFRSPWVVFREQLSGSFEDADTLWPFEQGAEKFSLDGLARMREDFLS